MAVTPVALCSDGSGNVALCPDDSGDVALCGQLCSSSWIQKHGYSDYGISDLEYFGSTSSINDNGTIAVVGDSCAGPDEHGEICVVEYENNDWLLKARFRIEDEYSSFASDYYGSFGGDVAINSVGDTIVVGDLRGLPSDPNCGGAVHIFSWDTVSQTLSHVTQITGTWIDNQIDPYNHNFSNDWKLVAGIIGGNLLINDNYILLHGISGGLIYVGNEIQGDANDGAVWFLTFDGSQVSYEGKLVCINDTDYPGDPTDTNYHHQYGDSFDLSDDKNTFVVADKDFRNGSFHPGRVYVYQFESTWYTLKATYRGYMDGFVKNLDPSVNNEFGGDVAVNGDGSVIAITNPTYFTEFNSDYLCGAFHILRWSDSQSTWVEDCTVIGEDLPIWNTLGNCVQLTDLGNVLVVSDIHAKRLHVFKYTDSSWLRIKTFYYNTLVNNGDFEDNNFVEDWGADVSITPDASVMILGTIGKYAKEFYVCHSDCFLDQSN